MLARTFSARAELARTFLTHAPDEILYAAAFAFTTTWLYSTYVHPSKNIGECGTRRCYLPGRTGYFPRLWRVTSPQASEKIQNIYPSLLFPGERVRGPRKPSMLARPSITTPRSGDAGRRAPSAPRPARGRGPGSRPGRASKPMSLHTYGQTR